MSKKVPKAHDSFVKNILGREVYARDFIRYYLPEKITSQLDLDTLEVSSKSFVSDELKENLTDLVMSLQFKNRDLAEIYMLIEHKSNLFHLTKLQLFGYLNEAWQNKRKDELPIIIPVVFYHGKKKWNYSLEFSDMFKPPEEHYFKYIPKFEHILLEVPEINKREIKSTIVLKVFNLTLEHIFYPDRRDRIYKAMELLFQGLKAEECLLGSDRAILLNFQIIRSKINHFSALERLFPPQNGLKGDPSIFIFAVIRIKQGKSIWIFEYSCRFFKGNSMFF